jgi:hypothetical protein
VIHFEIPSQDGKTPTRDGKKLPSSICRLRRRGPRLPTNFAPKDPQNPYADYSVDQLVRVLSGYKLDRAASERSTSIQTSVSASFDTSSLCVPERITKRRFASASASH